MNLKILNTTKRGMLQIAYLATYPVRLAMAVIVLPIMFFTTDFENKQEVALAKDFLKTLIKPLL